MKLYTLYTPSHETLHDNYFLKTLPNEFELDETLTQQICPTGDFKTKGWEETTYKKVETFLRAAEENDNEYFIFSDVDIVFFDKIKEDLLQHVDGHDIAIQNNNPFKNGNNLKYDACTGFFICKGNEKTRDLFHRMLKQDNDFKDDQTSFNTTIDKNTIKTTFLPYNEYWNTCQVKDKIKKDKNFDIPDGIKMYHANWLVGTKTKIKAIEKVMQKNNH